MAERVLSLLAIVFLTAGAVGAWLGSFAYLAAVAFGLLALAAALDARRPRLANWRLASVALLIGAVLLPIGAVATALFYAGLGIAAIGLGVAAVVSVQRA